MILFRLSLLRLQFTSSVPMYFNANDLQQYAVIFVINNYRGILILQVFKHLNENPYGHAFILMREPGLDASGPQNNDDRLGLGDSMRPHIAGILWLGPYLALDSEVSCF